VSCQSSLHLDSRRHHGLLLCAGGRLLSRDHDVPLLDASTVGDSEQGMEDKGLTSERAFGARVREATLGDDLSNAVVRHGDSLLGEGGECRNQTNHAVGEARLVLRVRRWPSRDPRLFVCPVLDHSLVLNTPQVEPDRRRAVVIGYQCVVDAYSPSSSRLPARATRRDCSRDGPVRDATLIVPAGDSDGIKPRDRRR
jgi:hypothetical protein